MTLKNFHRVPTLNPCNDAAAAVTPSAADSTGPTDETAPVQKTTLLEGTSPGNVDPATANGDSPCRNESDEELVEVTAEQLAQMAEKAELPDLLNEGPLRPVGMKEADIDRLGPIAGACERVTMETHNRTVMRELALSDLRRFQGLKGILQQLCNRNPYGETWLLYNPEDGSLEGFLPTAAFEIMRGSRQNASEEEIRGLSSKFGMDLDQFRQDVRNGNISLCEIAHKLTAEAWGNFELPTTDPRNPRYQVPAPDNELPVRIFYDPSKVPPGQPVDYILHTGPPPEQWSNIELAKDPNTGEPIPPGPIHDVKEACQKRPLSAGEVMRDEVRKNVDP